MAEIIGISGYARSGKDTIADILVEKHGFVKLSFADKLREALYELNPIIDIEHYAYDEIFLVRGPVRIRYVQEVIDTFGWSGYKETQYGPEIRRLLQRLGTEAGRETLGQDVWVHAMRQEIRNHPDDNIVIPDTRFRNEASMVEDAYDGHMWRVERPGVEAINAHPSETNLDDWNFDQIIHNDGTLQELENQVTRLWNVSNPEFSPIAGEA